MSQLDDQRIREALEELSRRLAVKGIQAEVCLFRGAAMILAFQARQTTKDIDAIFAPPAVVRELAKAIGEEKGYDSGWVNDGVKGFVSANAEHTTANLPQFRNLRVVMPVPNYLLAMKCMAARAGTPDAIDSRDVKFLLRRLGLTKPEQVLEIVEAYYPRNQIQPKTQYFVDAVLEELDHENPA